jgi:rare lipoprotein A
MIYLAEKNNKLMRKVDIRLLFRPLSFVLFSFLLAGCAETALVVHTAKEIARINKPPVPKGRYKVGTPYQINNVWYYPKIDYEYDETGIASWYGPNFHQKLTANGEIFDQNAITAAHRTLPMPSVVRVTNLENGRSLVVRINDRGPFAHGRIIDLSRRSAQLLGFVRKGTAKTRVQILVAESKTIAQRAKGGYTAAIPPIANNAPTPPAVPMTNVSVKSLPVIPGTKTAVQKSPKLLKPEIQQKTSAVKLAKLSRSRDIVQLTVGNSEIYVQVASFRRKVSAQNFQKVIADLGITGVYEAIVKGKKFHRVRIGPLKDVTQADTILSKLIKRGYPGARVVVKTSK